MKIILAMAALYALFQSGYYFNIAKSAIHEIEAILFLMIGVIAGSACFIIEKIEKLKNKED
jgi:hypothetical protein